jgi:EmrB/QacA subfamily drug resistance transporter
VKRIVPVVLAVALFMENMDSTVIATSLATIAEDIGTNPIALKLALTSYYVSLATFIPISGRVADRFGARFIFQCAIVVFMLGSLACALSSSIEAFVAARFLQGMGGAMMTPVGRLLLVRAANKSDLVTAMAWFSIPAMVGPLIGPPIGGAISTYADWRWIFLINLPIGLIGIVMSQKVLPYVEPIATIRFDWPGFVISGLACSGLVFGLSVISLPALPPIIGFTLAAVGMLFALLYIRHARRSPDPLLHLSLLKVDTLRASITGGGLFRIGTGALPFLLPLMLQLGFGYTPFESGLVSAATVGGAMAMKLMARPLLRRFGFRTALMSTAVLGGASVAVIGFYRPDMPLILLLVLLLVGGFFRSLFFTSTNALAFADVPPPRAGDATAMLAAFQQVSIATGVAMAGGILEAGVVLRGGVLPVPADFTVAFIAAGCVTVAALFCFRSLPASAGSEISGRR